MVVIILESNNFLNRIMSSLAAQYAIKNRTTTSEIKLRNRTAPETLCAIDIIEVICGR